ncbi:hypothetical protein A3F59_04975 [Candidatus Roizmanbacteria bacterium RIFCSPHIGHO2_12_FULL_38_13]|nr:MAG: hypothetical protein A3F59_04975 [Candidatus Roizmanbacteria bacterium RIFCSPHIGHO2_12_FULL_38_13]
MSWNPKLLLAMGLTAIGALGCAEFGPRNVETECYQTSGLYDSNGELPGGKLSTLEQEICFDKGSEHQTPTCPQEMIGEVLIGAGGIPILAQAERVPDSVCTVTRMERR